MDELDDRAEALRTLSATLKTLDAIHQHISAETSETVRQYFKFVSDAAHLMAVRCADGLESTQLKPELVASVPLPLPVPVVQT